MNIRLGLVVAMGLMLVGAVGVRAGAPQSAIDQWRARRFGMFIHWGPVSQTGREIGWSRGSQTPIDVYDNLYRTFNPTNFDAEAWVKIAKAAGMKYMVLTTKHHDGFCLWPSKYTEHDIASTPYGKDVVKALAEACRREGIAFGAYYSTCDWYQPDFPRGSPGGRSRKPNPNLPRYVEYLRNQVRELVENYGPLCTVWFDVPQEMGAKDGIPTEEMLRKLQPDIVINNRIYGAKDKSSVGDYDTPEQKIGGFQRDRPWETCMTICRQWSWKPHDRMKSLKQCVQTLLYTVGGDGNLLFNVGPMPDGRIEPRQVKRLQEMGAWLKPNAEAVYGTRGGPFKPGKWGASTCKGNKIYLFVMEWGAEGRLVLPKLDAKIESVKLLAGGPAEITIEDDSWVVAVSADKRDRIATVVAVTLDRDAFSFAPVDVVRRSRSLAFGKPAKASNVFQNQHEQFGPDKAVDDDPSTRWATDAGTKSAWLAVDLGEPREIGGVMIDEHQWNRVRRFEFQTSVDGKTWKNVFSGNKIGSNFERNFIPVKARWVRLNIRDASEGATIWEFQVFPAKKR